MGSRVISGSPSMCLVPCGSGWCVSGSRACYFYMFYILGSPKRQTQKPKPKSKKKSQKKSHPSLKSHPNSKKSKKIQKKKIFFLDPFCYKNVDKMFHYLQKVIFSLQKVKQVKKSKKKIIFLFFCILCKKHTVLIIFG